jgi:glycosyltransferase involved in cell wall biosynthesis
MPVKRMVILDHHSSDGTLEIAERNDCEVLQEDRGLGYARQLAIELASTEFFAMVESDLVYAEFDWYPKALAILEGNVGAVVAYVPRSSTDERGRYAEFWSRYTPLRERRHGFSAGSTLFRREAVRGIRIPPFLNAYEDIFIMREMRTRGWTYGTLEVAGTHYSDIESARKARWYGANARLLYSLQPGDLNLLRRHATLPIMGLIASMGSGSPGVFAWSLSFSANFLLGWSSPGRYSRLRR